jgi:histidine ammonia-lyase
MHASRKALELTRNSGHVLSVELICACQALDLRAPLEPSPVTKEILARVREEIDFWDKDRIMYKDIEKAEKLIYDGTLVKMVTERLGNSFQ